MYYHYTYTFAQSPRTEGDTQFSGKTYQDELY